MVNPSPQFHVAPQYQPLMRMLGLDADTVFTHPDIHPWRTLPDRENCRLDAHLPTGQPVRLHIKRYRSPHAYQPELQGHQLLTAANIPTAPLVAWGTAPAHGSFVLFADLTGFTPADKLLDRGTPFDTLLLPTADLAARLHAANLHHRDLYLCHFMARLDSPNGGPPELCLIDVARVKPLPAWFSRRWIVKDLAQFWYSTLKHAITDAQRHAWLSHYAAHRHLNPSSLTRAIQRKSRSIARHDRRLHQSRPERDVSIPEVER